MALVCDPHPVQALGTGGPDEPFGNTVRLRRANRRTKNLQAIAAKHVVKRYREVLVAIPDQKPQGSVRPGIVQANWRACRVTQVAFGCGVQPARGTQRLPNSMKKST